jgi:tetratricopeptide (TPR) repeat protein
VEDDVRELGRRELILPAVTSAFPDEAEFVFGHALIREVAYARLPRLARARKHALVAAWLDSMVGERRGSFADALGFHFEQAVLLAVAAGERQEADRWRQDAAEALLDAGISALGLDPAGAFARFERACAILPADDPLAVEALSHSALAGRRSGLIDRAEVLDRYRRVIAFHHERGDAVKEARAQANAGGQLMALARHDEARAALAQAAELLADHPEAAAERAHVFAWQAEEKMFAGNPVEAAALADRALTTGDAREPIRIMALHIRGDSRLGIGDSGGAVDLREALVRAEALGSVSDIITTHSYLADHEWQTQGPAVALDRLDDASALADRRGALSQGSWSKVSALELLFELGRWDDLLERAEPLAHEATLDESLVVAVRMWTTIVRLRRGTAVGSLDELLAAGHQVEELQVLAPVLAIAAEAALTAGEPARAAALAREFESVTRGKAAIYRSEWAPAIARTAIAAGAVDIARDLVAHSQPVTMRDELFTETAAAFVRETDGACEAAVWASLEERWRAYGDPFERAHVALALGRGGDSEAADRGRKLLASLGVPV